MQHNILLGDHGPYVTTVKGSSIPHSSVLLFPRKIVMWYRRAVIQYYKGCPLPSDMQSFILYHIMYLKLFTLIYSV